MAYQPGQHRRFNITLSVAFVIHLIVIFWVGISLASSKTVDNRKEVTLSITRQEQAPDNADFMAESNQTGSSEEVSDKELTTNNDALLTDTKINETDPLLLPEPQTPTEVIPLPRIITTSSYSSQAIHLDPLKELEIDRETQGDFETQDLTELSKQIASLEARLAERQQRVQLTPGLP